MTAVYEDTQGTYNSINAPTKREETISREIGNMVNSAIAAREAMHNLQDVKTPTRTEVGWVERAVTNYQSSSTELKLFAAYRLNGKLYHIRVDEVPEDKK